MFEQITGMIGLVLSPLTVFQPHIAIALLSVILTTLILGLNRIVTNRNVMKELKVKMEEVRENLTRAQKEGNKNEIDKFLGEFVSINNQFMKHTFKTLIVSLVVAVIFLPWLNARYGGLVVATLPFSVPLVGSSLSGIYWYVFVSLAVGWVMNKLFGGPLG